MKNVELGIIINVLLCKMEMHDHEEFPCISEIDNKKGQIF